MATNNPTPAAPTIVLPDAPAVPNEPTAVAEAGVTTSEWKLVVAYIMQLAVTATGTVIAQAGFHVSQATLQYVGQFEVAGLILALGYVASRTIRKKGTTA